MKLLVLTAAMLCSLPAGADGIPQDAVPGTGPGTYTLSSTDGTAVIPFEIFRNDIRILAEGNGRPVRLFVDNGYLWDDLLFFGSPRVDRLELAGEGSFEVRGSGEGGPVPATTADNVTVSFPGVEFFGQNAVITEYEPGSPNPWEGAEGQVSSCFFKHFVVGVDFDAGLITLVEPDRFAYTGEGVEVPLVPLPNGAWAVPGEIELGNGRVIEMDLMMDLGHGGALSIETGGPHAIPTPKNAIEMVLGYGMQGPIRGHSGRAAAVTIGDFRFDHPMAEYISGECEHEHTEVMIGMEIFSRFNVFFDYPGRRLIIEPNRQFADPMHYDMSGLFLRFADGGWQISRVLPDSPAAEAGLAVGDTIETIDGRPSAKLNSWEIRPMLKREGAVVRLRVRRDGETREVSITLRHIR